jgi:tetratricopeptide (TPR) repeat protein
MDAMRLLSSFLALFVVAGLVFGQGQDEPRKGRKPVLIRDDPNEKKAEEEFKPSPRVAEESVIVGDFYFRRSNWKAAEMRYRDAVRNNPRWVEAYEKLVKSLERQKAFADAIGVCEQFLAANPSSRDVAKFRGKAEELRSKDRKETPQNQAAAPQ